MKALGSLMFEAPASRRVLVLALSFGSLSSAVAVCSCQCVMSQKDGPR